MSPPHAVLLLGVVGAVGQSLRLLLLWVEGTPHPGRFLVNWKSKKISALNPKADAILKKILN